MEGVSEKGHLCLLWRGKKCSSETIEHREGGGHWYGEPVTLLGCTPARATLYYNPLRFQNMPREAKIKLEKVTMNLHKGDKDTLAAFHPASGWSVAARNIIHSYCDVLRERDSQEIVSNDLDIKMPPNIKEM